MFMRPYIPRRQYQQIYICYENNYLDASHNMFLFTVSMCILLCAQILHKYWKDDPKIFCWIEQATHVCLCGGYMIDDTKPSVQTCVKLYHTFQSSYRVTSDAMSAWIKDNTYVVFFSLKCHLVHMVKQDPALHHTLENTYAWQEFESVVRQASKYLITKVCTNTMHTDLNEGMRKLHDAELPHLYKLQKGPERDIICSYVAHREELDIVRSIGTNRYSQTTQDNSFKDTAFLAEMYQHMCLFIPKSPQFPVEWCKYIGISEKSIAIIEQTQQMYRDARPFNSGIRTLNQMETSDFKKLSLFCNTLSKVQCFRVYILPDIYVKQQLRAIQSNEETTVRHFCIACKSVASIFTCIGNNTKRRKRSYIDMHSYGHSKVLYDIIDDQIMCCKNNEVKTSNNMNARDIFDIRGAMSHTKRHNDTDAACVDFYLDDSRLCNKVSKCERKRNDKLCCADNALQSIDMLGKVLCIGKQTLVLCPKCLTLCEFNFALHGIATTNEETEIDSTDSFVFSCGLCHNT